VTAHRYGGPVLAAAALATLLAASGGRVGGHAAVAARHGGTAGYVNPLAGQQWADARTDQGVDYQPAVPEPVRAIGPGVVIASDSADCDGPPRYGWPGCHLIAYRLTAGPASGAVIYVAEHLTAMVPAGTRVRAGQPIATALPGDPWTEWGWASCSGYTPVSRYDGSDNGTAMPGGKAFARFMRRLGAATAMDPGPGPDVMRGCW
jgi:hypothetical protein